MPSATLMFDFNLGPIRSPLERRHALATPDEINGLNEDKITLHIAYY